METVIYLQVSCPPRPRAPIITVHFNLGRFLTYCTVGVDLKQTKIKVTQKPACSNKISKGLNILSINPYLAVWSNQFVAFARGLPTQYRKYEAKFAHIY